MKPKVGVVYRCYATDGELLYVGLTTRPVERLRLHAIQTLWFAEVARMEYDRPLPLDLARRSEREQIHNLAPVRNKTRKRNELRHSFASPALRHVGRNILDARRERGHTQQSVGQALGITPRAVGMWEVGRTVPSREHLEELASLFGVEPGWFYANREQEPVAA